MTEEKNIEKHTSIGNNEIFTIPCVRKISAYSVLDNSFCDEYVVSDSPFSADFAEDIKVIVCKSERKIKNNGQIEAIFTMMNFQKAKTETITVKLDSAIYSLNTFIQQLSSHSY